MKHNFLPSRAFNALLKRAYRTFLVVALILTISLNSFAHRAEPFIYGCIVTGSAVSIDANIISAGPATWYRWQFRDNSGNWRCFVNGTNATTINGVTYTVSGAESTGPAENNAPNLIIQNARASLENVLVRILMRDGALPGCAATPIGHTVTGNTYGGDDQALDESKNLRLHVFTSSTLCPPNAYACTNNMLVATGAANVSGIAAGGYYGGFENIGYTPSTGAYNRNNFATALASTDYASAAGATNKTYQDINNPYAKNNTYTKYIAPHSGNFQMVVEGSSTTSTTSDRVWYKSIAVSTGSQYRFDIWVCKVDASNPTIQIRANTNVLNTVPFTSADAIGTWKLIHGTYIHTGTNGAQVVFSIRETTGSKNFSLDDICLSLCTTNCAALPLHRLDLRAYLQGTNVSLKWTAENEMGTVRFVVERSTNGIDFDEIGSKPLSGPLNTPTEYTLSDDIQNLAAANVVYYRIRAADNENKSAYSNIATVRLNKTAGVQVWPNPFGDFVNITYNSSGNTKIDVSIVNSLGKVIKQNSYTVTRGLNQIAVNGLETLSSGIYFVRITDKNTNEVYIQKISK